MLGSIRWKVVVSLLISVSIPIGASVYFFYNGIVRAYSVAFNKDVEEALRLSVSSQREIFNLWKKNFRITARMHAADRDLERSALDLDAERMREVLSTFVSSEESLLSAGIEDVENRMVAKVSLDPGKFPPEGWRRLEVRAPLETCAGMAELVEEYVVPWGPFHEFENTGKTFRTFETSMKTKENVTRLFGKVYVSLVGVSVLIGLLVSYLYARRFSARIKKVAQAASEVGKGNLEIEVGDRSGDEVGILGRNFDMMVREIKESRERISYLQKISAWQEIARRLAHEIKNPLTPIQLSIQEMRSKYSGGDEGYRKILEDSAQIAMEEIESLRKLVTEFSGFARLPGVKPTSCSLNETLAEILAAAEAVCKERGVLLTVKLAPQDAAVNLDRMMMKRAVDNLVLNAIEAAERASEKEEGGERQKVVAVEAGINRERGMARITVTDSGEGVPEEDRANIFLPYFTKRKEGTGLGLAIVKKIVLEHGGEIRLLEREGRALGGACFLVEIPLAHRRGRKAKGELARA